jgi:TP901 family phage tail tape measure protein
MAFSADRIEVWIRARDARRFQAEMARSAASVREVGAAGATAGKRLGAAGRGMMLLTKSLKWGSIAVVGIAAEATKMGVEFDSAMLRIHTQADESMKGVASLRKGILDLTASGQVQQGPQQLADALYRLEGAGLRGATAMRALKAAADLAAVGNANVEDTAKTMAQTLFVGMKGTGNVTQLVAELNATVGQGDLKLQQLVDALGTGVTASAKQAGLSFHDVTGALAVFGDETNNVSGWSAQFATALHFLYAPTAKAATAMESMGLKSDQLAKDFSKKNGLVTALKDLRSHVEKLPGGPHGVKARQLLSDILPGGRGRVLLVLLNQLDRLQGKMKLIRETNKNFGPSVKKTQEQPLFRLRAAWAQVESAMIRFYDVIKPLVIPVLVAIVSSFAKVILFLANMGAHIRAVVKWWHGLPWPIKLAAQAIAIMIAQWVIFRSAIMAFGLIVRAFKAIQFAIFAVRYALMLMAANPIILALMVLVTVAVLIATHWRQTKQALGVAWHWLRGEAGKVFGWIGWAARHGLLGPVGLIISHWNGLVAFFRKLPSRMSGIFHGMFDGIKDAFRSALNWVIGAWDALHFKIGGWKVGPVRVPTITVGMPAIPFLASGGTLPLGGLGVVGEAGPELASVGPHGTTITPLNRGGGGAGLAGAYQFHFEVPVIVRGREIARATADEVSDWSARRGR